MRSCFAYVLILLFEATVFPVIIFLVLFSTLGNPSYVSSTVIPKSYDMSMGILAARLEKEIPDIKGQTKQDWLRSVFPKDTYANILREALSDMQAALFLAPKAGFKEIDFNNTKKKFMAALENALRSLPVCETASGPQQKGLPTCFPKEIPITEREHGVKNIMTDIDAGIPSRLTFRQPAGNDFINGVIFLFKNRSLILLFALIPPAFLLLLIILLLFSMKKRLFRFLGSASLVVSFESFLVVIALMQLASIAGNMKEQNGVGDLLIFLGSTQLAWYQWISIGFAALGAAGWYLASRFENPAPASAGIQHLPHVTVRNGKTRRGSTHQFIPF